MMTSRERLLRAICGEEVDRLPWAPVLAYWWEARPPEFQQKGGLRFLEDIGADALFRGFYAAWKLKRNHAEVTETEKNGERTEQYKTPVGTLTIRRRYVPSANTWFLYEHPVRSAEDLNTLAWLYEHTEVTRDTELDDRIRELGDRALALPVIGCEQKTCFQGLVETWVGTENLAYLVMDEPDAIENALAAMRRVSMETARISAESSAKAFIAFEDTSTTNINPAMFNQYIAPELNAWCDILHSADKLLLHHACGHLKALLPSIAKTKVDAIESISPPPTGNVDLDEAFSALPERIALIGGIEPVFFMNCTLAELQTRVEHLKAISKGRRYVLSNSDSCPPSVEIEKFYSVRNWI